MVEAAGEVAVDEVGDAGVEEEGEGEGGLRGEDQVADGRGGGEAREGEQVREVPYMLVGHPAGLEAGENLGAERWSGSWRRAGIGSCQRRLGWQKTRSHPPIRNVSRR